MAVSGLGLGALFTGLGEGYDAQNREMRAQAKEQREKEMFGIAKQREQLDLEAKQRDADYQKDLRDSMAEFMAQSKPTQVQDPATGQMIEKPGMDPIQLQLAARDRLQELNFKHGKVDLKMLKEAREFGKQIESEGAIEAMRYAMTNPNDQEGIRKIFNEKGKIKLGDDVQIGLQDGLFGPTVVGFKVGPKGEKIQVFDGFRDIIMPSMSADAYANLMGNMKITEAKERGDTVRVGMQTGSAERVAASNQANQRAIKGMEMNRKDLDYLQDMGKTRFTALYRNVLAGMEPERRQVIEGETMALARALFDQTDSRGQRKYTPEAALDMAQKEVFGTYKINTAPVTPKK